MEENPNHPRVITHNQREIPHGTEIESEIEFSQPSGPPTRVRSLMRKVDFGATYMVFTHTSRNGEPAIVSIVTGTKGKIEGDRRHDTVESMTIGSDGTILREDPRTVGVLLKNPFEGLSPQQIFERLPNRPSCSIPAED